jgi:hypothetical protein
MLEVLFVSIFKLWKGKSALDFLSFVTTNWEVNDRLSFADFGFEDLQDLVWYDRYSIVSWLMSFFFVILNAWVLLAIFSLFLKTVRFLT